MNELKKKILTKEEDLMFLGLIEPIRKYLKRKGLSYEDTFIAAGYYIAWGAAEQMNPNDSFVFLVESTRLLMNRFVKTIKENERGK